MLSEDTKLPQWTQDARPLARIGPGNESVTGKAFETDLTPAVPQPSQLDQVPLSTGTPEINANRSVTSRTGSLMFPIAGAVKLRSCNSTRSVPNAHATALRSVLTVVRAGPGSSHRSDILTADRTAIRSIS